MSETENQPTPSTRRSQFGVARRRKRRVRVILISVVTVVVLAVIGAGSYVWKLQHAFNTQANTVDIGYTEAEEEARPVKSPDDGSMNILLIGVDHSANHGSQEDALSGAVEQRSDSMMLVHIPEDRSQIYVMSTVRDMYVDMT